MATLPNPGTRSSGGQSLNLAMAGLSAVALAFFTFAMPDDLFSSLVARSGLPDLVAAAEPPLGMKARGAVIAAVAILVFALVLLMFRAIDRISARPAGSKAPAEEAEAPRLRRADAHPDAPARRPLLAGRDLGGYVEAEEEEDHFDPLPVEEKFADLEVSPLPGFLAAEQIEAAEVQEVPVEEPSHAFDQRQESAGIDFLVSKLPDVGEAGGRESISDLMHRLESGLSQRELDSGSDALQSAPAAREALPQWLDSSGADDQPPATPAREAAEAEEGETRPREIDFGALRSSGPRISELGEIEDQEEQPIDFAALRSSDRHISDFAQFEPKAGADEEEEHEEESAVEDESAGLGYASLRTRTPLDLSQPAPSLPEPSAEEEAPPVEPQVGHRLRGTINDLRRIASRG